MRLVEEHAVLLLSRFYASSPMSACQSPSRQSQGPFDPSHGSEISPAFRMLKTIHSKSLQRRPSRFVACCCMRLILQFRILNQAKTPDGLALPWKLIRRAHSRNCLSTRCLPYPPHILYSLYKKCILSVLHPLSHSHSFSHSSQAARIVPTANCHCPQRGSSSLSYMSIDLTAWRHAQWERNCQRALRLHSARISAITAGFPQWLLRLSSSMNIVSIRNIYYISLA
ncbi:hypothetical protein HETIRDRAFT_330394 [Heterobasidion irregulare TC 32-1]|uniref:Uncharacterized protein n=1 Tax=Heterobasidion irregulare (strain TC 32-1) TaxID=747525 RepID=W4JSR8_HETIT|nr:uncharacterized protein HETIRDRAFT_330394 [Heterobasidion irregulare TC 32-1]ETW76155.1 hypothetical protein HETIRDRAFT_330394 [Heterobasidion irregulare TC 32-1]